MEEEILLLSFDLDEPEALFSEAGNYSCLHVVAFGAPDNEGHPFEWLYQVQEKGAWLDEPIATTTAIDVLIIPCETRLVNGWGTMPPP